MVRPALAAISILGFLILITVIVVDVRYRQDKLGVPPEGIGAAMILLRMSGLGAAVGALLAALNLQAGWMIGWLLGAAACFVAAELLWRRYRPTNKPRQSK